MRHRIFVFTLVTFAALAVGFEWCYRYHFFFVEQSQLFLLTWDYFAGMATRPGGVSGWIAEALVQFFVLPGAGALITALLLATVGMQTALLCRRLVARPLYLSWVLPVLALLCVQLNSNYFYCGTVAIIASLCALNLYVRSPRFADRLAMGLVAVPLLFWLCGPVALLYALCAVVFEAACGTPRWGLASVVVLEAVLVAWVAALIPLVGSWRMAFTPHFYFAPRLIPGPEIWFAWIALPVVIATSRLCGRLKTGEVALTAVQIAATVCVVWAIASKYVDKEYYRLKRLDHWARTGRWDDIIARSAGPIDNYLYLNYLNLALAQKGILADSLFAYDQHGPYGLAIDWDRALPSAILLSDIHFCTGNMAIAREMAFEGYVATPGYGNPTLLKRLIETNLVYGDWPVAEKYLDVLAGTLFYRDWAARHRMFLGNDSAVEADPLLGAGRRCVPEIDFVSTSASHIENLQAIVRQNPSSKTAIEYLGSFALVAKDLELFSAVLDEYYGTEALPTLPQSFQQAVIILHETDPCAWDRYGVSASVRERFEGFKTRLETNGRRNGLDGIMRGSHGDTYWFYFMFK